MNTQTIVDAPTENDEEATPLNKVVIGASVGTVIEYYDFGIYSALALYIALNFFPSDTPELSMLLAVASTGIAFVVRPIGGMLFGVMSDKIGRKFTFMATLLIMSIATILMGLIPSYATMGIGAPILIVCLRMLQGLAVGGEYAAASTYVVEHAPDDKRGYYTGWLGAMTSGSLLLALLAVYATSTVMGKEEFEDWGWRLPFLYAAFMLTIALILRAKLKESPIFLQLKKKMGIPKTPLRDLLTTPAQLKLTLAIAFGVVAPQVTAGLSGSMLALYFLQTIGNANPDKAAILIALGTFVSIPMTVYFGALSDRVGRKVVQISGMIVGAVCFYPLFQLLLHFHTTGSHGIYLIICLLQVPSAMIVGPAFATITETFPAARRSTSVAFAFSTGGVIGGFAPAIALWLAGQFTNKALGVVVWPIFVMLVGAYIYKRYVPDHSKRVIWDDVLGDEDGA